MTSWLEIPGKKYLLPPEKPTTSCGNTGPTTRVTSCSTTARFSRTGTDWCAEAALGQLREPLGADRADRDEGVRVPPLVVAHRRAGIALLERRPAGSPGGGDSSVSPIRACVPSATSTVSRVTRPCSASCTAPSSSGIGQLRVPSGTSTHTLRPSRSTASSCSCTNARTCSSVSTPAGPPAWTATRVDVPERLAS